MIKMYFAATPESEPELCPVDLGAPPSTWSDPDVTMLTSLMGAIGQSKVQRSPNTFDYVKQINDRGAVSMIVHLISGQEWPRLWTEPLDIPRAVLDAWWNQHVTPQRSSTVH